MKTGLFHDMPEAEYFGTKAASNSTLGRMIKSPAHCRAYLDKEHTQTPAMALGSLVHCLVLEANKFESKYAIKPEGIDRRTKAGKEAYQSFADSAEGKEVITQEQLGEGTAIAESVLSHPAAIALLDSPGSSEVSAFWHDEENDIACKCRFDRLDQRGYIVDLKTTRDASAEGFGKSVYNFGYHRQAAMYSEGFEAVTGDRPKAFLFVAVETEAPYAVAVYRLDDESLAKGYESYRGLLAEYSACDKNDNWPGYDVGVQTLELPRWAK